MTAESAQAFWAKVKQDTEFRSKLAAAATDQELEAMIRDAGFVFTAEELQNGLAEWKEASTGGRELSEKELDAVAGGSIPFSFLHDAMPLFNAPIRQPAVNPLFKG